jgi:hypothetical protein
LGEPIKDSCCLTYGECLSRCPRGVLHLDKTNLINELERVMKNKIQYPIQEMVENV